MGDEDDWEGNERRDRNEAGSDGEGLHAEEFGLLLQVTRAMTDSPRRFWLFNFHN